GTSHGAAQQPQSTVRPRAALGCRGARGIGRGARTDFGAVSQVPASGGQPGAGGGSSGQGQRLGPGARDVSRGPSRFRPVPGGHASRASRLAATNLAEQSEQFSSPLYGQREPRR